MGERSVIKIDLEKCNGCGLCIPNCPEGALRIIDGKARLISDLFCDGLGACIGRCPKEALTFEKREAKPYDEIKVMQNIIKQGKNVIKAHLSHLKEHNQIKYLEQALAFLKDKKINISQEDLYRARPKAQSELRQWPIQITLVPPNAMYLQDADLLIAGDCVPFAYAHFQQDLLKGKILLVGCPKLDDLEFYKRKISEILKNNNIKSITCAHMEVPCCFGLVSVIQSALADLARDIAFQEVIVSIRGERLR